MYSHAEREAAQRHEIDALIREWLESTEPVGPHCSNCCKTRVSGTDYAPDVRCAAGHGDNIPLVKLIRQGASRSWRAARNCPDYEDSR